MTAINALADAVARRMNDAIDLAFVHGKILPAQCHSAMSNEQRAEALNVNEMLAATLCAITGQSWKVLHSVTENDSAYQLPGSHYICSPAFAEKLLAELKDRP